MSVDGRRVLGDVWHIAGLPVLVWTWSLLEHGGDAALLRELSLTPRCRHRRRWILRSGSIRVADLALLVIASCAVAVAWRAFNEPRPTRAAVGEALSEGQLRDVRRHSLIDGAHSATVEVFEFGDFQCPFCASFHSAWTAVRRQYHGAVMLRYVHAPAAAHRFAVPAAVAAECAAEQDRFGRFADIAFQRQSEISTLDWPTVAAEAGVSDAPRYLRCLASETTRARVAAAAQLSARLGVRGTPTVIVDGTRVSPPVDSATLDASVRAALRRRGQ